MPWRPLRQSRREQADINAWLSQYRRRSRFLVDEDVDVAVADYLRGRGFNVRHVVQTDAAGRDDSEVWQLARREGRILVTHNAKDFYENDAKFPLEQCVGVAVLDGRKLKAAVYLWNYMGRWASAWRRVKVKISDEAYITQKVRDFATGRVVESRFHMPFRGEAREWVDE